MNSGKQWAPGDVPSSFFGVLFALVMQESCRRQEIRFGDLFHTCFEGGVLATRKRSRGALYINTQFHSQALKPRQKILIYYIQTKQYCTVCGYQIKDNVIPNKNKISS